MTPTTTSALDLLQSALELTRSLATALERDDLPACQQLLQQRMGVIQQLQEVAEAPSPEEARLMATLRAEGAAVLDRARGLHASLAQQLTSLQSRRQLPYSQDEAGASGVLDGRI